MRGKGEMGAATLVIFIALLIVAGITAGVIIQAQNAQQEATLSTATAARREVTTQVELIDFSGTDGRDGALDYFSYKVRLKPGAEAIRLNDVVLYMNTYNDTLRLIYRPGECHRDAQTGYFTYR
jgi:archaeal flagellin FlaB